MAASSTPHENITKKLKTKIWPPGPEALRPEKQEKRHLPEVPAESFTSAPVPKSPLTKGKQPAEESSAYYEAGGRTFKTVKRSNLDYILKPQKEDQGENKISTGHENDNYEQGSKTKGKQRDAEEDLPPPITDWITRVPSMTSDDHRSFDSLEVRSLDSRATLSPTHSYRDFRDWLYGGPNRQFASSSSQESLSEHPEIPALRDLPVPRNYYTNEWTFSQGFGQLRSPLVEASHCGDAATLNILIDKGAEIDMQFAHGQFGSALVAASFGQFPENVKVLLDRGADVNLQVAHGLYGSALVAASFSQYPENVKVLLDRGADINLQVVHGKFGSALAAASESPRTSESVKILLEAGADVNLPLSFGSFNDAMSVAVYSRNAAAIKLLFEAGAKVSPLAASLIQRAASNNSAFCNDLKGMASDYTCSPETLRLKFYCELPSLAADRDDTEWLFNMGVLIRKKDTVEFATLQDYLSRSFDATGLDLLRGIVRALETPLNLYFDSTMMIQVLAHGYRGSISIESSTSTPKLLEIFKWICLTVRRPFPGLIGLSSSTMETMSFGLPETHYDLRPIRPLPKFSRDNCCWHGLFSEAVISQAPGLGRQTTSRGLELDFLRMLQLSAVEYPVFVESGLILMGYSAALVPIKETNDGMILWHLETSRHDSQFKVSDIKATNRKWLKVNSFDYLQSKRALIGWCSEANILLGTDRLAPRVTWSNAKVKATTWHWKGANLQVLAQSAAPLQMGGQIGFSFDRVLNTVQFNPSENYLRCLRNGVMEHVVLYDVGTERAWLVPLICVLHHMLLVYSEGIENEHRVNHAPKATISGPSASFMTLSDKGSLVLERSGDDSLTIRELIMGLSANLSKASLHKPARSEIYGYELMDVLMGSPRSELKKRRIKKEGLAWSSLLDGISCLFCSDLGDAIVGRRVPYFSSPCNSLPIGYNFMAASMQSIENLSMTHGVNVKSNFRQLSRAHFWQLSGSPFQRCRPDCQGDCWRCPDFLQAVRTARPSDKDQDNILSGHSKGALVFGAPLKGKMVEMTTLPTVFTKQPREIKILEMKSWYRRKYRLQSDIVSESSKKTRQGNNRTFVISD